MIINIFKQHEGKTWTIQYIFLPTDGTLLEQHVCAYNYSK